MPNGLDGKDVWKWAAVLLAGAAVLGYGIVRQSPPPAPPQVQPSQIASATSTPSPSAAPAPVLQKPGDLPADGPRTMAIGTTSGEVLGSSGTLKRFRIAIESNVAGEMGEFTELVDQTLGDARSWIAGRQYRFQRVADGQPYDFTVYLVTRQTAYHMCRVNGVDIRENGVPYTSCRQVRQVIINLDRWRLSVPEYVSGGITLQAYRQYVINHEVGHELGRGHEACPGTGQPAPTMLTQTLSLKGCVANAWPYIDGKRHSGPPAR